MRITVLKVAVNEVQGTKGPYQVAELAYKNNEGQLKSFKVMSFNRDVFEVVSKVSANDMLDVEFKKDPKGYWQMISAKVTGKADPATATAAGQAKGNWETSEERAARQVFIARQSSISNAIKLLELQKAKPSVEDVVTIANQLTEFVFSGKIPVKVTGDVE